MEATVKAFLQSPDGTTEVRRFSLMLQQDGTMFKLLSSKVVSAFPGLKGRNVTISWLDSDGDYVLMSTDEELQDALAQAQAGILKVFVADIGELENQDEAMTDERTDSEGEATRHDLEMPEGPMFRGRGGRGKMRGRGHWGHPHGPHAGPFNGPHAGPFQGPPVGPFHGPPAGPFHGPHGFHRPHHGPWNRMNFPPAAPFHHPMFSPRMMMGNPQDNGGMMGERRGWKRALRESVPVSHRRWAKIYIHNWRCQNLTNVTTTSSDSEQDRRAKRFTKESAGVPEAYVVWLDMILPKFHKRWEADGELTGISPEEEDGCDSLATLRMSVPVEFREWARWFLRKRYGKRSVPEFKRCKSMEGKGRFGMRDGCGRGKRHGGKHGGKHGGCKGKWNKAKLGDLAVKVARPVRLWAKHLIYTWQLEQQIPVTFRPAMSDTEDQELQLQDAGVPEDYGKWLLKLLPKWHAYRGLFDSSKVERVPGEMAQFKMTVPQEFRAWVKCYLAKHFSPAEQNQNTEEMSSDHQRWLQIFKRKWLQQKEAAADSLWASTSEDEGQATTSDPDTDVEMNSSFKKMRLEGNKKSVQFDKSADESDSDTANLWGKKPGPAFRQFAKGNLSDWDGVSVTDGGDGDSSEIPAHVHRWLCRMMLKKQEKQMRQMKKAAKRETRLAKKELKAISKSFQS